MGMLSWSVRHAIMEWHMLLEVGRYAINFLLFFTIFLIFLSLHLSVQATFLSFGSLLLWLHGTVLHLGILLDLMISSLMDFLHHWSFPFCTLFYLHWSFSFSFFRPVSFFLGFFNALTFLHFLSLFLFDSGKLDDFWRRRSSGELVRVENEKGSFIYSGFMPLSTIWWELRVWV